MYLVGDGGSRDGGQYCASILTISKRGVSSAVCVRLLSRWRILRHFYEQVQC